MSRNPTHDERIAHMEYLSQATGITTSTDHFLAGVDYARAAVAELIEACESLQQHPDDLEIQADFCRALARVRGAA